MQVFYILLLSLSVTQMCKAYKILLVLPTPGKSHSILADAMIKKLTQAGHEVTYITPFPKATNENPSLREIDISILHKHAPECLYSMEKIMNKEVDLQGIITLVSVFYEIQVGCIENENVTKLFNDPGEQFDVVVLEWMYLDLLSGISQVFNCPYIWFSTVDPHWMVLKLIDELPNPAYTTSINSFNEVPLTFLQRAEELFQIVLGLGLQYFYLYGSEKRDFERLYGPIIRRRGREVPDFEEVRFNASLMLGYSHVSMGLPIRLPQNYKPVGGYHIDEEVNPLPEDLQKLLDNATHGLIYFSMGSLAKSKNMPEVVKAGLLKIFGKLKQMVLWKFEEDLPNIPSNVFIVKWAPQQSILAHPNCILFITHGGVLSTTEAIYFGKPMIGIPVFADQFNNIDRFVKKGIAKKVDPSYNMADDLKIAIDEILSDPRYSTNMKTLSDIYHDRPASPSKEVVHWIEHVVRTKGAQHLRSPALMMPWYQKCYLDLGALVIMILWTIKIATNKIIIYFSMNQQKKKLL